MATIKKPIRIGDDTPLRNFQAGEAVGPDNGGTGLSTADLSGQAGKVLTVNGTEDGWTLAAGGGGGSNGIYGGSGTVPDGTNAELAAGSVFRINYSTLYNGGAAAISIDDNNGGILLTDPAGLAQFGTDGGQVILSAASGSFNLGGDMKITSNTARGIEYNDDYSATIAGINRAIPDVGTVNLLKQTPVSYTNAAAPNNTIFYSTTDSKLSYKDPGGTVHNLY